jgi:hypothetical protein
LARSHNGLTEPFIVVVCRPVLELRLGVLPKIELLLPTVRLLADVLYRGDANVPPAGLSGI